MKISDSDYQTYLYTQIRGAKGTQHITECSRRGRRRWIYWRMQELGLEVKRILCVGARHDSELSFFEEKGIETEGIDLYNSGKIVQCDMSKILVHPYFKTQKYDMVFSCESIEHCIDLDGFIEGLNEVCLKYFVCACPSVAHENITEKQINPSIWDCAIHQFQIDYPKYLLDTFTKFKIIVAETHKTTNFFVLEKK